jgi:hypothetical protein
VTNKRIRHHHQPPRLERVANSQGSGEEDQQTRSADTLTPITSAVPAPAPPSPASGPSEHPIKQPLGQFDIYVDDFLGMAQGNTRSLRRLRRTLFTMLDEVLRPKKDAADGEARQEPISVKKLRKGNARWSTTKQMLGWIINTVQSTITLPPHRVERLFTILDSITPDQRRVSIQKWQLMVGELRAMAIAIPGARGIFSHLQAALQTRNLCHGRIRVSNHVRATLDEFKWLADSLQDRPDRLQEVVAQPPCVYGTRCQRSKHGWHYFTASNPSGLTKATHALASALPSNSATEPGVHVQSQRIGHKLGPRIRGYGHPARCSVF